MNYWDELMETDEGAANYMETYGEGPGSHTRKTLGSFINEGETVLDVGCGPGWNLDHFIEHGPTVGNYKGTDYSERFVRVANKRSMEKYEYEAFEVGDCREVKEGDESWDVVLLQDVVEHTNGYEKPVREALRVAKKRVIVVFWRGFMDRGEHQINDDGNDGYGATYDKKLWEDFVESLDLHWMRFGSDSGTRHHDFYIIDKEETHGKR